jgi:hypothetical protein
LVDDQDNRSTTKVSEEDKAMAAKELPDAFKDIPTQEILKEIYARMQALNSGIEDANDRGKSEF